MLAWLEFNHSDSLNSMYHDIENRVAPPKRNFDVLKTSRINKWLEVLHDDPDEIENFLLHVLDEEGFDHLLASREADTEALPGEPTDYLVDMSSPNNNTAINNTEAPTPPKTPSTGIFSTIENTERLLYCAQCRAAKITTICNPCCCVCFCNDCSLKCNNICFKCSKTIINFGKIIIQAAY
jgi:hypothetical protein